MPRYIPRYVCVGTPVFCWRWQQVRLGVLYKRFHWLSFLARQNTRDTDDTCELDFNPTTKTTNKLFGKLFDHISIPTFC